MKVEEEAMLEVWLQEVYEIDSDRSTEYIIQHLTDTVKEFYSMKNKFIGENDAHAKAMKFLNEGSSDA